MSKDTADKVWIWNPREDTVTTPEGTPYPCHKCKKTIKEHKPDAEKSGS